MRLRIFLLLFFLTACAPQSAAVDRGGNPELLTVYVKPSAEELLPLVYSCAGRSPIRLASRSQSDASPDIYIRLSTLENIKMPAYQVGKVEVLVVMSTASSLSALTREEIVAIFQGHITNWSQVGGDDASINLWVYSQENDLQEIFNETLLGEGRVSTLARQAQSQDEMCREIAKDENALGIISHAQAEGNLRILYSLGKFPVLAFTQEDAKEEVLALIECLQGQ